MKKESLGVPSVKGGTKYDSAAKGSNLAKGVSHYEGNVKTDLKQPSMDGNQRPVKGTDRI